MLRPALAAGGSLRTSKRQAVCDSTSMLIVDMRINRINMPCVTLAASDDVESSKRSHVLTWTLRRPVSCDASKVTSSTSSASSSMIEARRSREAAMPTHERGTAQTSSFAERQRTKAEISLN